jgi:predicted ArsR family transcriptional regulator
MAEPMDTKHRLLARLKRATSASAAELAEEFGFTDTAIRQHLEALERAGLVERVSTAPSGRGRPPLAWRVTPASADAFPDRHADLTVELIDAVRTQLGDDALQAVLNARSGRQKTSYASELRSGSLLEKVQDLARLRTAEGYLAEAHDTGDGTIVLVEHHCPIAGAARTCGGLCTAELDVFRSVLGPTATVQRRQHLLAGDPRCDYTITPIAGTPT